MAESLAWFVMRRLVGVKEFTRSLVTTSRSFHCTATAGLIRTWRLALWLRVDFRTFSFSLGRFLWIRVRFLDWWLRLVLA